MNISKIEHIFLLVFSLLVYLCLPPSIQHDYTTTIEIKALGERNIHSHGNEVWILADGVSYIEGSKVLDMEGWERREGALLSYRSPTNILRFRAVPQKTNSINFLKHNYSGLVEIQIEHGPIYIFDLYSSTPTQAVLELDDHIGEKIDVASTLLYGVVYLTAIWLSVLIIFRTFSQKLTSISSRSDYELRSVLLLSVTPLIVFVLSCLVFWPAQMSPDSLDQWRQIVTHDYHDAHPFLSTIFYAIPYSIFPSPGSSVLFQSLVFSLSIGLMLEEIRQWGAGKKLLIVLTVLISFYPATFFLTSTMWKDVPFSICILVLSTLLAKEVRSGFLLSSGSLYCLSIVAILCSAFRHNGILVSLPLLIALAIFFPIRRRAILKHFFIVVVGILIIKILLPYAVNAEPIGRHYKAMHSLHILGAMEVANVPWEKKDSELIYKVMPKDAWRSSYRCDSVVPLFWNHESSFDLLAADSEKLNSLALRWILKRPMIFIEHQLCLSSPVWRITAPLNEWSPVSPFGIYEPEQITPNGLKNNSILPSVKKALVPVHEFIADSKFYLRPAFYVFISLFLTFLLARNGGAHAYWILAPSYLNAASIALLASAPDYRYMYPSALCFFLIIGVFLSRVSLRGKQTL